MKRLQADLNKHSACRVLSGPLVLSLVTFLVLSFLSGEAMAVPADPHPVELGQADGGKVKVFLKGDEFHSWNEDAGGYTILKDTGTRNWVYAQKDAKGAIRKTAHKVGRADPKTLGLDRHLQDDAKISSARAMRLERDNSRRLKRQGSAQVLSVSLSGAQTVTGSSVPGDGPLYAPITSGTMKNLVILAKFSDDVTTYSQADFNALFNQVGYTTDGAIGSVRDYYTQVSYGKLTMQSTVSQWVTLPQTAAYYGAGNPDANPQQMVIDAINALDAAGFDFATVDGNNDGEVDGLDIIHSGKGEESTGNSSDYIWAQQWELASTVVKDGKSMKMFHTEAEVRGWDDYPQTVGLCRVGVICHETGHFLGLPDLYDYGGDSVGVGKFCLMGDGPWNGDHGTSPAHMSAYCKKRLGWAAPVTLSSYGNYSLPRVEDGETAMYKFSGAGFAATEYFLMENRQGYGFDAALPGPARGILIWHVDEAVSDTGANNNQAHYKVDLEEASGTQHLSGNVNTGDDSDYFRSGTLTAFKDSSTPDSKSYGGSNLVWAVQNISATGNTMTLDYFNPSDATAPSVPGTVNDGTGADISQTSSASQLSANWGASSDAQSGIAKYWYAIGTTAGGTNVAGWTDNGAALTVSRTGLVLTDGQIYYFTVKAENGVGLQSAAVNSNGQTVVTDVTPPSNVPQVRDGAGADAAWSGSLTQLSANWDAASDPDSGISKYYYAIGTTAGGTNVAGWTDNGAALTVTRTGLGLADGQMYYFTVKAQNGAGLQSSAVNSNGQRVDATAPSTPGAVSDGTGADITYTAGTTQLSANWAAAADAQSGITKYWYAIGTTAGGTNVAGWTDNGSALAVTRTGLSLTLDQISELLT